MAVVAPELEGRAGGPVVRLDMSFNVVSPLEGALASVDWAWMHDHRDHRALRIARDSGHDGER